MGTYKFSKPITEHIHAYPTKSLFTVDTLPNKDFLYAQKGGNSFSEKLAMGGTDFY